MITPAAAAAAAAVVDSISSRSGGDEHDQIKTRPTVLNRNNMEAISTPIAAAPAVMAAITTNRQKQRLTFNMVSLVDYKICAQNIESLKGVSE